MLKKQAGRKADHALVFDHISLTKKGPTLALDVPVGSWLAIAGPTGSGKSFLADCISGARSPSRGAVSANSTIGAPFDGEFGRRDRPQLVAKAAAKGADADAIAQALTHLGLWDVRQTTVSQLSIAQQSAMRLLKPLLDGSEIVVIDQYADIFDPWITDSFCRYLRMRMAANLTLVQATHRTDFLKMADQLIVLNEEQIVFCGTQVELCRRFGRSQIIVETNDQKDVRALVGPFEVKVDVCEDGLHLEATEGQAIAARLLLEGYGDVRCVIDRETTFEEALRNVIRGPI